MLLQKVTSYHCHHITKLIIFISSDIQTNSYDPIMKFLWCLCQMLQDLSRYPLTILFTS